MNRSTLRNKSKEYLIGLIYSRSSELSKKTKELRAINKAYNSIQDEIQNVLAKREQAIKEVKSYREQFDELIDSEARFLSYTIIASSIAIVEAIAIILLLFL